jgi:hypothetical protein
MKYVAVKILMAESSTNDCGELWGNKFKGKGLYREIGGKHICLPLDQFQIDGPNGLHLCFVYPVLGPCDPTAPKYLVKPIDFYSVDSQFMTNEACIIDFGESFEVSSPPEDLGIAQS